jgi:hypothetical protein
MSLPIVRVPLIPLYTKATKKKILIASKHRINYPKKLIQTPAAVKHINNHQKPTLNILLFKEMKVMNLILVPMIIELRRKD